MTIDDMLLDFIRVNPGVGLLECGDYLLSARPELFERVQVPVRTARNKAWVRLTSMLLHGFIRCKNPTGRKAQYYIRED